MAERQHSPEQVLRAAVGAAIQAPSSHNTQPWRFRISGSTLEVHADPERHLSAIDAERRQQIQSCGCALFNARLQVRAHGYADEVTIMVADGAHRDHLATLRLGASIEPAAHDQALVDAIPRRRTNRREFLPRPVALAHTDRMRAVAADEGAELIRLTPDRKDRLAALVETADRTQYADPAFRAELARWLTSFGSRRRDGIPFVEKEYGSALPFSVMRKLRSSALGNELARIEHDHIAAAPVVVALGTRGDDPIDWFACGQALQAVLLYATSLGLSASFLNQVLEVPALREHIAALLPELGAPHMIIRVGVPGEAIHHPAPRRDVDDVLIRGQDG